MKEKDFDDLLESVREAGSILRGERRPARVTTVKDLLATGTPDVGLLRAHFKLSQVKFAALLGISVGTLQNWEQGRRSPDGPARVLLRVASAHPAALLDVAGRPTRSTGKRNAARRG